jgi:RNA polymerase sigma-70 factor, ECF subfamily
MGSRAGTALSETLTNRFEREVLPLTPTLYSHALYLTRNHPDAQDLLQDTLLRAFTGFPTFRRGTNIRAWLYRIQNNSYISGWRRRQRRLDGSLCDNTKLGQLCIGPGSLSRQPRAAEDEALDAIADPDIALAMRDLPEKFRTVVYYADVEGLPTKHIAALTDSPMGTVASRLHRGRRHLRRLLGAPTDASAATAGQHAGVRAS